MPMQQQTTQQTHLLCGMLLKSRGFALFCCEAPYLTGGMSSSGSRTTFVGTPSKSSLAGSLTCRCWP